MDFSDSREKAVEAPHVGSDSIFVFNIVYKYRYTNPATALVHSTLLDGRCLIVILNNYGTLATAMQKRYLFPDQHFLLLYSLVC